MECAGLLVEALGADEPAVWTFRSQTLPRLAAIPATSIRSLMAASFALGADRLAALIRESPSADHLLPLTTALDWELGKDPRVALEIREVAEDMRRELAGVENT